MLLQLRLDMLSVLLVMYPLLGCIYSQQTLPNLIRINETAPEPSATPNLSTPSNTSPSVVPYDPMKPHSPSGTTVNHSIVDEPPIPAAGVFGELDSASIMDSEIEQIVRNVSEVRREVVTDDDVVSAATTPVKQVSPKLFKKPDVRKRKTDKKELVIDAEPLEWKCPNITSNRNLECGCDMPHTLRCSGDIHSLGKIADAIRQSPFAVSLLDCTLKNVTFLSDERIFENISLHGLVISSGEIKRVHRLAFQGLASPLQALGLPNNALLSVPWNSLAPLNLLDRLDLSNNRIKALGAADFLNLPSLTYLELSDNQISSISLRTFSPLKKLTILKLNGNRMGDFASSLHALGQSINLREIDLKSNSISGPLTRHTLPSLPALESLNLDRNSFTSIQNAALQSFPYLVSLSLRHNQIDVLQDHAFSGLSSLQNLDLAYNGIVAVSGASLQHLGRLLVLDLTHNFLRALTSDLIAPLPALRVLRLDGNDISIVSKNALDGARELHSLSLQDNPLSCDCTLKPFAEWLSISKIPSQDLLGAICTTPPHLEGAPLLQIPVESLSCDGNSNNEFDNANVLQQLGTISRETNLSYVRDSSDVITLKKLHLSADYGMILTWSVNMRNDEFTCDAVFVYKETNVNEILLDNSPIHCESYSMDDENIVSVILRDTSGLVLGESYRFCLVLLHEKNIKRDLVVGCSNITRLQAIEDPDEAMSDTSRHQLQKLITNTGLSNRMYDESAAGFAGPLEVATDYEDDAHPPTTRTSTTTTNPRKVIVSDLDHGGQRMELFGNINRSFLPGLALGILITGFFALIWGAAKLKASQPSNPNVSTCYAASTLHLPGGTLDTTEHRNRYLKLQATTSL